MKIFKVPPELQSPHYPYPAHDTSVGLEAHCHDFVTKEAAGIRGQHMYLPIYWMNNYYKQNQTTGESGYRAVPAVQEFLDTKLNPQVKYVTVVQSANGTYEKLPPNVKVLGSSGVGDVALPLVCQAHPRLGRIRNLLASYVGAIECGGPTQPPGTLDHSTSTPDAPGALIRRDMVQTFLNQDDCYIEARYSAQADEAVKEDIGVFRDAMYHSKFALAPRGYGRTSFRLFEAMQLGCVPVYIADDPWLPYSDVLDWTEFCVLCSRRDLPGLPGLLRETAGNSWYEKASRRLPGLVLDYFSFLGVTRQLPRIIQDLDK